MCEYSLKGNLNGLEQQIVCELNTIVCIICKFFNKQKVNQNRIWANHFPFKKNHSIMHFNKYY